MKNLIKKYDKGIRMKTSSVQECVSCGKNVLLKSDDDEFCNHHWMGVLHWTKPNPKK